MATQVAKPLSPGEIAARMQGKVTPANTAVVVDYLSLPPPVRYEELQREVMMTLKPDCFEGLRFEFSKPFNHNFAFTHSVFMGNMDVPTQNNQPIKMPMGTYEFGANLASSSGANMMIGRIMTDGRMSGRVKYEVLSWLGLKLQMQLAEETGMSQVMMDAELKGKDWNGQLKWGNNQFYGMNYLQAVTPRLALGGEAFYLGLQRKCGIGLAGRYVTPQSISTFQVASTNLVSLSYVQKVSEKVSLASDFVWNLNSREATASFGYDYMLRQCRLRGRIDSDGKVGAYLEERINAGINFVLSAELDHPKKDYKFGFGMVVGE